MYRTPHHSLPSRLLGFLAALVLTFTITASAWAQAVMGPGLESTLNGLAAGELVEVVVTFNQEDPVTALQLDAVAGLGITQALHFETLPIMGMLATADQINALAARSDVLSIWPNEEQTFYNYDGRSVTGVDKARTDSNLRNAMGLPYSGKGIGVVVNDSGIDGTLPDVEYGDYTVQNVQAAFNLHAVSSVAPYTYLEDQQNTDTGSGHGTHVAGTVGGRGVSSGGFYEGVAPGADLIGYGSGTAALLILDGIGGFEYAITRQFQHNIRIITNSWGSSGTFDPAHPINVVSYLTYKRGITVLFAAGNSGPGENTHNPYAQAPWVISVGAGEKNGNLAGFSSRGNPGETGDFTMFDGSSWTYVNEPTVVAPGVDIISSRATTGALPVLAAEADVANLGTNAAFYTTMSGTSMATPHVAGITALMIEADPTLSPDDVKTILTNGATNMTGRESWEVGAGYVNAYNALLETVGLRTDFGATLNNRRDFACSVDLTIDDGGDFTIDYNPAPEVSADGNSTTVDVPSGLSTLIVNISAEGIAGETGNAIYPVLISPSGVQYSSGTTLLFAIEYGRTQTVDNPEPGTWTIEIRGIQSGSGRNVVSVPETVNGSITFKTVNGFTGLDDIAGHGAEASIQTAVGDLLVDCDNGGFRPSDNLTRGELAEYLVIGAGVRQSLPTDGSSSFGDVSADLAPYAEAVTAMGAALRDRTQYDGGVMLTDGGAFNPGGTVSRTDVAYSLVQSLGLEDDAQAFSGDVMAQFNGLLITLEDSDAIPAEMRGYVQAAIDLGLLNVYFSITQGTYDLEPVVHAEFRPDVTMTRGDYAVAVSRFATNF